MNALKQNKKVFREGMRDGIPIALAYLAVSFALGLAAKNVGLTIFQGTLTASLMNASAGEYAAFMFIKETAPYFELALMVFIANSRYLLMSFALSQRMHPDLKWHHRLILGFYITDEWFGITIAQKGYINPYYTYGAIAIGAPCWILGTFFGIVLGNILPASIVSALSMALYGMFLAIIIPPAKENKIILGLVISGFVCSYLFTILPYLKEISGGLQLIILTISLSSIAAILYPINDEDEKKTDDSELNDSPYSTNNNESSDNLDSNSKTDSYDNAEKINENIENNGRRI